MTLDQRRARLNELNELLVLQEFNPDAPVITPALEAEADMLGLQVVEEQAKERIAQAEQLPPSDEVQTYIASIQGRVKRDRAAYRESAEPWAANLREHYPPASLPVGRSAATPRESRPAAGRTRGSRRSTTRSSSSSDDPGGDSDEPARGRQLGTGDAASAGDAVGL